jgi:hypothetical protein
MGLTRGLVVGSKPLRAQAATPSRPSGATKEKEIEGTRARCRRRAAIGQSVLGADEHRGSNLLGAGCKGTGPSSVSTCQPAVWQDFQPGRADDTSLIGRSSAARSGMSNRQRGPNVCPPDHDPCRRARHGAGLGLHANDRTSSRSVRGRGHALRVPTAGRGRLCRRGRALPGHHGERSRDRACESQGLRTCEHRDRAGRRSLRRKTRLRGHPDGGSHEVQIRLPLNFLPQAGAGLTRRRAGRRTEENGAPCGHRRRRTRA